MYAPSHYKRRILLAACGMTPQVVTETLHALCVSAEEPFPVNEIRLVTTAVGREQAINALITGGKLQELLSDHGLGPIHFDADCIEVIRGVDGTALDDIQTPEQNRLAADCITEVVRRLTGADDTALHVSLAGGRKTMGYYIGYALSLYGRVQDRLSHVLVDADYEGLKDFFYPTPRSRVVEGRNGKYLDTRKARVMLAEIPFVRLRDTLPPHLLHQRTTFSEAVRWSNLDGQSQRLEIDLRKAEIRIAGERVDLIPKELALYAAFARAAKDGEGDFEGGKLNRQLTRALAEEFARMHGLKSLPDTTAALIDRIRTECDEVDPRTVETLRKGVGVEYLRPILARIRPKFEKTLGKSLAEPYLVKVKSTISGSSGKIPLYGLTLAPASIRLKG